MISRSIARLRRASGASEYACALSKPALSGLAGTAPIEPAVADFVRHRVPSSIQSSPTRVLQIGPGTLLPILVSFECVRRPAPKALDNINERTSLYERARGLAGGIDAPGSCAARQAEPPTGGSASASCHAVGRVMAPRPATVQLFLECRERVRTRGVRRRAADAGAGDRGKMDGACGRALR